MLIKSNFYAKLINEIKLVKDDVALKFLKRFQIAHDLYNSI